MGIICIPPRQKPLKNYKQNLKDSTRCLKDRKSSIYTKTWLKYKRYNAKQNSSNSYFFSYSIKYQTNTLQLAFYNGNNKNQCICVPAKSI